MRIRSLVCSATLALSAAAVAGNGTGTGNGAPPPLPTMEFSAFLFLFPPAAVAAEMLDPIDINAMTILFDGFEDPDAFDNTPRG